MAKLKAPLFSLGASQKLGDALVYFPWKGLNVVRQYVIPTNPQTAAQQTHRGRMTTIVDFIHARIGDTVHPTTQTDMVAWAALASTFATVRTWFNALVKQMLDQLVAGKRHYYPMDGATTPGNGQLAVSIWERFGDTTTGNFWYGTSKTALVFSKAGAVAGGNWTATITGLTNGTKYYWQFRPTAPAAMVGSNSGIYYGTPAA